MMKHTHRWCQTPPSVTVRIKASTVHTLQIKRGLRLKRPNVHEAQGPSGKSQSNLRQDEVCPGKLSWGPTLVIQREEMSAFFRIFDDDLIQDFLWMDCCCKITDKYLLAMTFIYFKRAGFSISEHNRTNFFIALYLANTMEEDEEESKYEIFPWALGKSWRKHFTRFLRQRDKLWARIEYRAAVSRRCCEEVMAIVPTHFLWQRERAEHHSGAQRQYCEQEEVHVPRGPAAPPAPCALCAPASSLGPSSSSSAPGTTSPLPFTLALALETTPPRAQAAGRRALETIPPRAQAAGRRALETIPPRAQAAGRRALETTPPRAQAAGRRALETTPPRAQAAGRRVLETTPPRAQAAGRRVLETTPPRAQAAGRRAGRKTRAPRPCCSADKGPESDDGSRHDASMDWINQEE